MFKIFYYEFKRFVINKLFLGLSIIQLIYAAILMNGEIIYGVANTAPFSPWSFGTYMGKLSPILLLSLLYLISSLFSKKEQSVLHITNITVIDKGKYYLVRIIAIMISYIILVSISVVFGIVNNYIIFNIGLNIEILKTVIISILPSFLLILGLGLYIGNVNPKYIVILMGIVVLAYNPLNKFIDLYGIKFFSEYPYSLNILDPSLQLSKSFLISRIAHIIIGIGTILLFLKNKSKQSI